jgi:hypothetical protein
VPFKISGKSDRNTAIFGGSARRASAGEPLAGLGNGVWGEAGEALLAPLCPRVRARVCLVRTACETCAVRASRSGRHLPAQSGGLAPASLPARPGLELLYGDLRAVSSKGGAMSCPHLTLPFKKQRGGMPVRP